MNLNLIREILSTVCVLYRREIINDQDKSKGGTMKHKIERDLSGEYK